MENIDNLNFKVILDDKEFNEKVETDIKTAKRLNASLSDYLTAKNKLKGNPIAMVIGRRIFSFRRWTASIHTIPCR